MRHSFAGLAIPTFPYSTADGHWLPEAWNFRVAINFTHRVMAVAVTAAILWFSFQLRRDRNASLGLRFGASLIVTLVALQILLGAQIIWTQRSAAMTTGHVLMGALTLVTTFCLTWIAHRDVIEGKASA